MSVAVKAGVKRGLAMHEMAVVYASHGNDLGGGGSTSMFRRELMWQVVAPSYKNGGDIA